MSLPSASKPLKEQTWEMHLDGGKNGGGGINKDAYVKSSETGEIISLEALYNKLKDDMKRKDARKYILDLQEKLGIK